jgi:hypothetical protein
VGPFRIVAYSSLFSLQLDPDTVAVGERGGEHRDRRNLFEAAQSFEGLFEDFFLEFNLCFRSDMLPLAAAAEAEIRAGRGYTERRGEGELSQHADAVILFFVHDLNLGCFPLDRLRHKDDLTVNPGHRVSLKSHRFNGDANDSSHGSTISWMGS